MKQNYTMDALNRDGEVIEVLTDARSKDDAAWVFGHSPAMMGMRPRWFTLRKVGSRKPKMPKGHIDYPQRKTAEKKEEGK